MRPDPRDVRTEAVQDTQDMVALCAADELAPGEMRSFELPGRAPVAVYNVDGVYYCTDDTCTHGNALLTDGELDGTDVVCPFHEGAFDVRTGKPTAAPCLIPLKTYRVAVVDGHVLVALA